MLGFSPLSNNPLSDINTGQSTPSKNSSLNLFIYGYLPHSGNFNLCITGHLPSNSGVDLYINGSDGSNNNLTLYETGHLISSGNVDLFINGFANSSGNLPLYTFGSVVYSGTVDLFTKAYATNSGNFDLFLMNQTDYSGNLPLFTKSAFFSSGNQDLYIGGLDSQNLSLNLFIKSQPLHSGTSNLSLFTWSTTNSGQFALLPLVVGYEDGFPDPLHALQLYTTGPASSTVVNSMNLVVNQKKNWDNNLTLFLRNDYQNSGNLMLYLLAPSGIAGYNGAIDTYLHGKDIPYSGINLYLKTSEPSTSGIPLFLWSTTNPAQFATNTLFIKCVDGFPNPLYSMNLYTSGPSTAISSRSIDLFLSQDTTTSSGLNLVIRNDYIQGTNNLPLFMAAPSGTYGAVPNNAEMPLFMSRQSEAIAGNVQLYLKTSEQLTSNFNLFVNGANYAISGLNLFTNAIGVASGNQFKLYTHGF